MKSLIAPLTLGALLVVNSCQDQEKKEKNVDDEGTTAAQSRKSQYDEVHHAMVSDLVVIGEVVDVEEMHGPESECFHSKSIVKIDSVLRGKINARTLGKPVLLGSRDLAIQIGIIL